MVPNEVDNRKFTGKGRDQERAGTDIEFGAGRTLFVFFPLPFGRVGVQVALASPSQSLSHFITFSSGSGLSLAGPVNENACSFPQMREAQ